VTATTWLKPGWAAAAQGASEEGPQREQAAAVAARCAFTSTIRAASPSASVSTVSASHVLVQELPEDRELCEEPRPSSPPAETLTWPTDLPEEPREESVMEFCDDMVDIGMLSLKRFRVGRGELHGEPMARER
jgi:hypothetical protein